VCYDGYDGVACQRASCPGYPNSCSGHGTCKSKKQLAKADNYNVYKLWDKDTTMGCDCDHGYFGPDCSERACKSGVDPLYLDDTATIKYSIYDFATLTTSSTLDFTDGFAQPSTGYWAIRFYDITGEDWLTAPIPAGATCSMIIAALEGIPNNVIPPGMTECSETRKSATQESKWQSWDESNKVPAIQWVEGPTSAAGVNSDCNSVCQAVGATCQSSNPWSHLPTVQNQIIDLTTCTQPNATTLDSNTVYDLKSCSITSTAVATQTSSAMAYAPYYDGTNVYSGTTSATCNSAAPSGSRRFCPCSGTFWQPTFHPYQIRYNMSIWEADTLSNPSQAGLLGSDYDPLYMGGGSGNRLVKTETTALSGYIYRIKFFGNPGKLPQPDIEIYLDGKRPTLQSQSGITNSAGGSAPYTFGNPVGRVITKVWTDGQQGESSDYFADHCAGVTVTIGFTAYGQYYLTGLSATEKALLKTCLGSSDFDSSNNVETYNWDYGSRFYPHLIKLVRSVTVYTDGGYYAALYYVAGTALDNTAAPPTAQGAQGTFFLLHPFSPPDAFATDNYEVYTTKGTFALTSNASEATFSFGSKFIYTVNASYDTNQETVQSFDGDISCEIGNNNAYKTKWVFHCLNKSDIFTFLNWQSPEINPPHLNLYTAQRIYTKKFEYDVGDRFTTAAGNTPGMSASRYGNEMHYMTHVITTDISTNWGVSVANNHQHFNIYKFFPATASTYNYVSQCSNRGICNTATGTCQCFPGYTNDDCSIQNSISL